MKRLFLCDSETALVRTKKGMVKGYFYNDVFIFKGIPYAKARRFREPEELEAWEDVFDATSFGYVCPLLEMPKPGGELMVPHRYWVMNEDCQNLNIWTPGLDGQKRPVVVWLHGGGYEAGSAIEQIAYEGENMAREGQVVSVSINHRLNVLGYCDLSDFGEEYTDSGNAGTNDIIASLQWIRDNIASFGGDPDHVTLIGQSGGGAKITTLLQSPKADGLFHRGIIMSGVIGSVLADAQGSGGELVLGMMKELDIREIQGLETVPYSCLAAAYAKVRRLLSKDGKYVGGCPHPNEFYAGEPVANGFRPETAKIPLIIGSVFGEFTSFMGSGPDLKGLSEENQIAEMRRHFGEENAARLLPLFKKAYPDRCPADLLKLDFIFREPEIAYIKARSALNDSTYSYLFNQDLPLNGGQAPWHCSDVPFIFHNTSLVPVTQKAGMTEKLENEIFGSAMAFAHTGSPQNEAIPEWKFSKPDEENTMIFDSCPRLVQNFDHELIGKYAKIAGSGFMEAFLAHHEDIQH